MLPPTAPRLRGERRRGLCSHVPPVPVSARSLTAHEMCTPVMTGQASGQPQSWTISGERATDNPVKTQLSAVCRVFCGKLSDGT